MKTEVEAKFLNIDVRAIHTKLHKVGADNVAPELVMVSRIFDYPDRRLEKKGGWVRVREEGKKSTLSYKQVDDLTLHGTKEVSVAVADADAACELLIDIGLALTTYEEKKRESWTLKNCAIEVDTWPWIPTFLEIEGPTEESVKDAATQLGLSWNNALFGSVEFLYQRYFQFTVEEFYKMPELRFGPVPDWLAQRRKK